MKQVQPLTATAVACCLLLCPAVGSADDPPFSEGAGSYSPYERATLRDAIRAKAGSVEPHPEGKIIENIEIVALDVFVKDDWLPQFLTPLANWFHVTSRHDVLERDLLVSVGDRYDVDLIEETARNLRGLPQLSLVLIVPMRGSREDRVRLLVVTKDVWSLRLDNDFIYENGRLQRLRLQPDEQNLFGTHQVLLGNFLLDAATVQVGGAYTVPRVWGSRIRAYGSATMIQGRGTGQTEGSTGSFVYEKPLFSTRTEWAWNANLAWDYEIRRRYVGGLFTDFDGTTKGCAVSTNQSLTPDAGRCQYKADILTGGYSVTRSFGTVFKHDLILGVSAGRYVYETGDISSLPAASRAAFASSFVPVSDTRIGPYFEYHGYSATYLSLINFETLGLVENIQTGHSVTLRVMPTTRALNSSRDFVDAYASASYAVPLGDGLFKAALTADTEIASGSIPDGTVDTSLRIATPRFGIGRLVFDAHVIDRYKNYLNVKSTLGGDTRLRGYPAQMFAGNDLLVANLEFRSRPVEILAVQFGGVLFADVGDSFDTFSAMRLKQSTGVGLRAMFPQFQRAVVRLDVGFPVTPGPLPAGVGHFDVVVTYNQALPELWPSSPYAK